MTAKQIQRNKFIEGLGILLMVAGIGMIVNGELAIKFSLSIIGSIVAPSGWLLYSFSEEVSR